MKAHELAYKLRSGPDLEVIFVEEDREYGYHFYVTVDEIVEVTEKPKDGIIEVPYLELQ